MAAISTKEQSRAGLVALGATVKALDGVTPLGVQSYDYNGFFKALVTNVPQAVTYPCAVATPDLQRQKGFENLGTMGGSPKTYFNMLHIILYSTVANVPDFRIVEPQMVKMWDHYDQALAAFSANGGWSAVSHGPVNLVDDFWAIKYQMEGVMYNASIYKYGCELFL